MFSSQGRAYPDVAAMGHNYRAFVGDLFSHVSQPFFFFAAITVGGQVYVGSGTSASTPVVAGMFTLINVRVSLCLFSFPDSFVSAGTAHERR